MLHRSLIAASALSLAVTSLVHGQQAPGPVPSTNLPEEIPTNLLVAPAAKPAPIWATTFSPDGKYVAIGYGSWNVPGILALWDTGKLHPVWLHRQPRGVRRIVFSPDGRRIATVSYAGRLSLHEASTGKLLFEKKTGTGHAYAIAYSPDGKHLVSGGKNGIAYMWNAASGEESESFLAHPGGIYFISFGDANTLYTAGGDNLAKQWNVKSMTEQCRFEGHTGGVEGVLLSPDGQCVATCSIDRTVRLWATDGSPLRTIDGHDAAVLSIAFSPDGKRLTSGSGIWSGQTEGTAEAKSWQVETGKLIGNFEGHDAADKLFATAFSADGKWLITGGWLGLARLWDAENRHLIADFDLAKFVCRPRTVVSSAIAPDGNTIAIGDEDGRVSLIDSSGVLRREIEGFQDVVSCISFSPDGRSLAAGSYDTKIRLWEVKSGKEIATLGDHTNWICSIAFSPDGTRLASGGFDKVVRLWDVNNAKSIRQFEGHTAAVRSVAFSSDGQTIVSGSSDQTVRLWQVTGDNKTVLRGHRGVVRAVCFAPDGKTLISGGDDKMIRVWNAETFELQRTLAGHEDSISALAFAPKQDLFACGDFKGVIRRWETATGRQTSFAKRHNGIISTLTFSPNGEYYVSGSTDETLKLWRLPAD